MAVVFDLTLFIKETQLQHGLRAEDYVRYHHYTTNRLAALRQQLNLSNDKKKFLHKEVAPQNATDARHLMLLALYAERCWAEAEVMQVQQQAKKEARGGGGKVNKPKGGVPPPEQYRKRLNKSVKWAAKLHAVASAVATERVKAECAAYLHDTAGRCHASHSRFKEAKESFLAARDALAALRQTSSETQWGVIAAKVNELDDRVTYCMQRLGEDVKTYLPAPIHASAGTGSEGDAAATVGGASQLSWNGRTLNVFSIKVKDALREAQAVEVEATEAKLREASGVVPVGQSNRLLDLMDRRLNYYNDALAHARQDLRSAPEGSGKTEYQLIVHYILFHVAQETLRRTLFLAEVYSRRFEATERTLKATASGAGAASSASPSAAAAAPATASSASLRGNKQQQQRKKKAEVAPSQYASPLEVVRLYQAAATSVEDMELLPGVSGRDDVEALGAVCAAGQLFFTGESWRLSQQWATAMQYYRDALALLREAAGPYVASLQSHIEQRLLQGTAEVVLAAAAASASSAAAGAPAASGPLAYLSEAGDEAVQVAQGVMRFPPDYQAAPCKPVFVDIASTFVDYPMDGEEEASAGGAGAAGAASATKGAGAGAEKPKQEKKKGWFGWGS